MMFESSSSPFDEALAKPFLGEPTKKKFSLASSRSSAASAASTVATMLSNFYEDDNDSVSSEIYEAPTLDGDEVIVFRSEDDNEEVDSERQVVSIMKPLDIEAAILQERHGSFKVIHQDMSQILEIQNDLSALVESQGEDIESLQIMSIEAKEHAEAGVKHLREMNHQLELKQQRRFLVFYAMMMFVGAYWIFGKSVNGSSSAAATISIP